MAATTSELLTALTNARNTIRTKLVALGLVAATAKLADCATAIDGIDNNGAVSAQVKEGESYTIPQAITTAPALCLLQTISARLWRLYEVKYGKYNCN